MECTRESAAKPGCIPGPLGSPLIAYARCLAVSVSQPRFASTSGRDWPELRCGVLSARDTSSASAPFRHHTLLEALRQARAGAASGTWRLVRWLASGLAAVAIGILASAGLATSEEGEVKVSSAVEVPMSSARGRGSRAREI
jgi:hypothetical protein